MFFVHMRQYYNDAVHHNSTTTDIQSGARARERQKAKNMNGHCASLKHIMQSHNKIKRIMCYYAKHTNVAALSALHHSVKFSVFTVIVVVVVVGEF